MIRPVVMAAFGLGLVLLLAITRPSHAQLEPCRRPVTPLQPMLGEPNDTRRKASTLEPHDLERRRAAAGMANWSSLTPSDWRILAENAFSEGSAREAFRQKQFDGYQKKEVAWTGAWRRIQAEDKEDYYLAPWIRLETALRNRDRDAMAAVDSVLDAARKAGVEPSWGGDRRLVAEELLRKATPARGNDQDAKDYVAPALGLDVREALRPEDLIGLAELWAKLSVEDRKSVNEVLDFKVKEYLTQPDKRARELLLEKLVVWVKALAANEISEVVSNPPPRSTGEGFDTLPRFVKDALFAGYKTPEARAIIDARLASMNGATRNAMEQALLDLMDAQQRTGRVPASAYVNVVINTAFPTTDSVAAKLRSQLGLWENKKDGFYPYILIRTLRVPALAAKERKEANIFTDARRKAFDDAMLRAALDPALQRQRERERKEREVRSRSGFESALYMARGFVFQGKDTVTGLAHMVVHPIETAEGLWFAVNNPSMMARVLAVSLDDSLEDTDDFAGRVGFEVALALATAGTGTAPEVAADSARALNLAAKEAMVAGKVDKARRLAQEAEKMASAAAKAKELTTGLRSQLIDVAEESKRLAALARNAEAVKHAEKAEELTRKATELAKAGDMKGARLAARQAVEEARGAAKAAAASGAPEALAAAEKAAIVAKEAERLRDAGSAAKKWKAPSAEEYAKLRDLARQAEAKREIALRLERSIEHERAALREGRPLEVAPKRSGARPELNQTTRNGATVKEAEKQIAQYQADAAALERELAGKLNPRDALMGAEDAAVALEIAKALKVEKAFQQALSGEIAKELRTLDARQRLAMQGHYEQVAKAAGTTMEDVAKQVKRLDELEVAARAWNDFVKSLKHHDNRTYDKHLKATSDVGLESQAKAIGEGQYMMQYKDAAARAAFEKEALLKGYRVDHGGSTHVFYKAERPVGATDKGKLTEWVRVEIDSTGKVHSHPRPYEEIPLEARKVLEARRVGP